jgi:hypothetical protein
MLSATLISDFTSVLIDVRDTFIILPKPVSDRTFVVARLLHIFIHICKIVLPLCLPGLVYMIIDQSVYGAFLFLLLVWFVTAFSILFINAVYLLILRFTTPQKFQAIISYVQIVFAILVYASYQIVPRMMSEMSLENLDLTSKPWIIAYPLYWPARAWEVLYTLNGSITDWSTVILAIALPVVSLYIVIRHLAPSFNNKLAMMQSVSTALNEKQPAAVTAEKGNSYSQSLARILTRSSVERMGFLFTWKMMGRSRDFKLKVYPSIGYLMVYVVFMFFNSRKMSLENLRDQGTAGKLIVISALYLTSFLLTMALAQMVYSDKYKASWIFYTSPVRKPGEVILGAAKAAIFRFYIPIVLFISAAGIILVGPQLVPNILLGLFNELLIATLVVYVGNKYFPFSTHQNADAKSGAFLRNLLVLFISAVIALLHFFIYDILPVVIIFLFLSVAATWTMMNSIRSISWKAIKSSYKED